MFTTEFGKFDGKSWEDFCQKCFKEKYEAERYQEIPATTKGDLGIEGFTETGKVFQCYCPDFDVSSEDLYKKQRTKINADLKKIEKYCGELAKYLNGNKIKNWIFVTPEYRNKELVRYCKEKANEYKKKGLTILESNFDVLIYNSGYFSSVAPSILEGLNKPLDLSLEKEYTDSEIIEWKSKNITLVDNAFEKLHKVVPAKKTGRDQRVNSIISNAISYYLNGNEILERWRDLYPEKYEAFLKTIGYLEKKLSEDLALFEGENKELFKQVQSDLVQVVEKEFPDLAFNMRNTICNKIFYGWILECPLHFE